MSRSVRTLLCAITALALTSRTALAHAHLVRSTPAANAHLLAVPTELRLTFSEPLAVSLSRLELRDSTGALVTLGKLVLASDSTTVMIATVDGKFHAGTYTVTWHAMAEDGHPSKGDFTFVVDSAATGLAAAVPATSAQVAAARDTTTPRVDTNAAGARHSAAASEATLSPTFILARWLTLIGVLGLVGSVVFRHLVLGALGRRVTSVGSALARTGPDSAAGFGALSALILLLGAALRLASESLATSGQMLDTPTISGLLMQTIWGWGWMLQVFATVVALMMLMVARRGSMRAWKLLWLPVILLVVTPAMSGHAVATSPRWLSMSADALHVFGASGWVGGLALLALVAIPAATRSGAGARGPIVAATVNAFSPVALLFSGLTAASGVLMAWLHLGTLQALWTTDYGRVLLIKLALLAVAGALGAFNWLVVRPSLGEDSRVGRIRISARMELLVGIGIIVVTAVLTGMPIPMAK